MGSARTWDGEADRRWIPPSLRRLGSRLARGYRAVQDKFPLTWLGLFLSLASWLALRELGKKRQDVVLYVAALGAGSVVLVSVAFVLVTALWLWRRSRRPAPISRERLEAGRPIETGFSLPSLAWLPLVSIEWDWVEPEAVRVEARAERGRLMEEVVFGERGEHARTIRRVQVTSALGLSWLAWRIVAETPRIVYPGLGRPLSVPLLEMFAAGDHLSHPAGPPDGDLVEMRRYVAGDPMKRILWKTFAKSRVLMVRNPERAISPTHRTLAYLVAGEGDEAAASVARLAVESGALGPEWRFSADLPEGQLEDASDAARALSLIVKSRAARSVGGRGLGPFLERSIELGGRRCVVFAAARPGPWLPLVEEQVRLHAGSIEVVLGTDGVSATGQGGRWRRLFLLDEEADLAQARVRQDRLEAMTRRLTSAGATVTVVDRPTGKLFGRSGRRRRA